MARHLAHAVRQIALPAPLEALRLVVVCGCALALIAADRALPLLNL